MAQYPPPPQPDQQHYNALYPSSAAPQPLIDSLNQQQLQYANSDQPDVSEQHSPSVSIQHLARELTQHAAVAEEQRQLTSPTSQQNLHQLPAIEFSNSQPNDLTGTAAQDQRPNRLRKACDSCSIRKVKCDEAGPPCRACATLDIPCTFARPRRRRGPPNKHAEAVKRRRAEEAAESPHLSVVSSPSSPTHAARALASLSSHASNQQLSADSLCPHEMLASLIDDFFLYVHPFCPFPHEPSFREAWRRREDLNNNQFLALLASMIGAFVASFPRKARFHLKAHSQNNLFPNHMSLINRCQKISSIARGLGYLESENLSVYDAATSYFLALTGIHTFRWRQGRLYFGECLTILSTLGLLKPKDQALTNVNTPSSATGSRDVNHDEYPQPSFDNITLQMGRRIFWSLFASVKTIQQLRTDFRDLVIPPPTTTEPYPPFPVEVADFCVYPGHTDPQPEGLLAMITGFNANARVYVSYDALATLEIAWGVDTVVDWDRQRRVLHESLQSCKHSLDNLPTELSQHLTSAAFVSSLKSGSSAGLSFNSTNVSSDSTLPVPADELEPEERRRIQYEMQMSNMYTSRLLIRSYIVERYWTLSEAHDASQPQQQQPSNNSNAIVTAMGLENLLSPPIPGKQDKIAQEMRQEREDIVRELLSVFSTTNRANMEVNADSFTIKIRSIAEALLHAPASRNGTIALQAQQYLAAFLAILTRLEHASLDTADPDRPDDPHAEIRIWADLREHQAKFAEQGGLAGLKE